eukprot:6390350-Karenia_brevis.AAC.1
MPRSGDINSLGLDRSGNQYWMRLNLRGKILYLRDHTSNMPGFKFVSSRITGLRYHVAIYDRRAEKKSTTRPY